MNELKSKIEQLTKTWKEMSRNTIEERNIAESFYKNEILPLSTELFNLKYEGKVKKTYDFLILSVGTSLSPLIFSITTLKPKNVVFMYTAQTKYIVQEAISIINLSIMEIDFVEVDSNNPLDIYEKIKIFCSGKENLNIAIDFTTGTKAMSAGAALAGAFLEKDLYYIGNKKYLKEPFRQPEPGTEYLIPIENPFSISGDLEIRKAFELWRNHNYSAASNLFNILKQKVRNPRESELFYYLTKAYESWDNLDLKSAYENLVLFLGEENRYALSLFKNVLDKIKKQQEILKMFQDNNLENVEWALREKNKLPYYLIFMIVTNGLRREKQGKLDIAALLIYRTLELIEQKRLFNYGFNTAEPDYSILPVAEDEILQHINTLNEKVNRRILSELPEKISLVNGFMLLDAIGDEITEKIKWDKLIDKVQVRNLSILAHGFSFVIEGRYKGFKYMVLEILKRFCSLEEIIMENYINDLSFVVPEDLNL